MTATTTTTGTSIHTTFASPVGQLTLVADAGQLTGLYFPHHWYQPDPATFGTRSDTEFGEARRQLAEYFAGERDRFDLPVDARGDEFQHRVWDLVSRIPYGQTTTYGDLARELSGTTARPAVGPAAGGTVLAKDVGAAVGRNPLCIIVPCHRVVGKNGALTGYAGGLGRKRFLLNLEEPAEQRLARLW
jgi:methylated-DNA-[protein]-cysteine S-methyltransferase